MNKIISLTLVNLFAIIFYGQSTTNPIIRNKTESSVHIKSIETNDYFTQINFFYKSKETTGRYIFLNSPGNKNAYYIRAINKIYKLLSTQNIGNSDGTTLAYPGTPLEFSARLERLAYTTTEFDLLEGSSGQWNFYRVQLNGEDDVSQRFRMDYNYIAFYDPEEGEWSEWDKVDNTFVFNINENGDIAHIRANGKTIIYKKLTGVEKSKTDDGEEYQIMNALDEDGNVFRLQIFDNPSVGLKMMYGDIMVQFAKY